MSPREFAVDVVRQLRDAGYEALWAGGCVRDELLGRTPKDYDVATNASPSRVRRLFGRHRTVPVGAAFGVMALVGPPGAGTIEVVTFRSDSTYSDGRHPDRVTFSSAREDALRRDFTINGMFYDPLENRVIDYVGGLEDLELGIIRAIGDARQRIAEDKLRMLRAVRFAAVFAFRLDEDCLHAIREHAAEIGLVSAERIVAELRMMLSHPNRRTAAELLVRTRLLPELLPEGRPVYQWTDDPKAEVTGNERWQRVLRILDALADNEPLVPAWTALLGDVLRAESSERQAIARLANRWRMTNDEAEGIAVLLANEKRVLTARQQPWPVMQRILVGRRCNELLQYCEAVAKVDGTGSEDLAFCRAKLQLPSEVLNPPPLITGNDLRSLGIPRGPIYREILDAVRDEQLEGRLQSRDEALQWVQSRLQQPGARDG